jgi:hypothetical protein
MTNSTYSTANKTPQGKKRKAYVSCNHDEWDALQKLGFRERWAYMQLKWMANFKTGMLGNFRKQKLTYQDIAGLVIAPGVQGRGQGNIDDKQAAEFVQRMQAVGLLVAHGRRDNGGLVLELPLSPINRKASVLAAPVAYVSSVPEANSPENTPQKAAISPDEDICIFEENPATTRVCEELTPSLSVLSLTKLKNNTDVAQAASAADAPSSRATGAAAASVNSRQNSAWTAPLTADAIHDHLSDYWDWDGVETPKAWTMYHAWARKNLSEDMLFQAVQQLEAEWSRDKGPCTPFALAPVLADVLQQNRLAA